MPEEHEFARASGTPPSTAEPRYSPVGGYAEIRTGSVAQIVCRSHFGTAPPDWRGQRFPLRGDLCTIPDINSPRETLPIVLQSVSEGPFRNQNGPQLDPDQLERSAR